MSGATEVAAKLGPKQRQAVVALARCEAPPTSAELADVVAVIGGVPARERRPVSEGEAMANTLRSLERKGVAERIGMAFGGARIWRLTDFGDLVREELA